MACSPSASSTRWTTWKASSSLTTCRACAATAPSPRSRRPAARHKAVGSLVARSSLAYPEPGRRAMKPILTAFKTSPDRGRGPARDMPGRWALEEGGQPYDGRLGTFAELKAPAHRAVQPVGQIPTYEEDGLVLFESAAIVLHIAERHPGLLPAEPAARARAIAWMFAAVSTVQPPIVERERSLL